MESNVAQIALSHRAWGWFEKNRKQALNGALAALLVGILVWFIVWRQSEKQIRASQALSSIATAQFSGPGAAQDTPQAYLKVVADYPKSAAAPRALLLAAGGLFTDAKYNEAQAQFERFTREYRDSPLLGSALLGIASCLEAQGKTDQAVSAYKDLVTRHPSDSVIPQAKFSLAGLYEAQKRPELARDLYEQVAQEGRYGILGNEAGMRLEELAEKNPNLAPAAAPAPMPAPKLLSPAGTNAPVETEKK